VTSHVAGFYQSLHLNLGECYRKLGDLDRAREQFERGQAAVGSLGDDGYGQMINGGLDRGQAVRPCSSDATQACASYRRMPASRWTSDWAS